MLPSTNAHLQIMTAYLRILRQYDGTLWDDLRMRLVANFGKLRVGAYDCIPATSLSIQATRSSTALRGWRGVLPASFSMPC